MKEGSAPSLEYIGAGKIHSRWGVVHLFVSSPVVLSQHVWLGDHHPMPAVIKRPAVPGLAVPALENLRKE